MMSLKQGLPKLTFRVAFLVLLAALFLGSASLMGVTSDLGNNPYRSIADRNVFGLQDPPVAVVPPDDPVTPASNVKLTGITKVLGQTRILMLVQEMGPKGPLPESKEESYMLSVGQAQGPIEVLEMIDEKEGKVRIKNAGKTMVISFDTHGTKLAAAPAATAAVIPAPPTPGRVSTQRGARVQNARGGINVNPTSPTSPTQLPSRPVRSSSIPAGGFPQLTTEQEANLATHYLEVEVNAAMASPDIAPLFPPTPLNPETDVPQGQLPSVPPTPFSDGGPASQLLTPVPITTSPR